MTRRGYCTHTHTKWEGMTGSSMFSEECHYYHHHHHNKNGAAMHIYTAHTSRPRLIHPSAGFWAQYMYKSAQKVSADLLRGIILVSELFQFHIPMFAPSLCFMGHILHTHISSAVATVKVSASILDEIICQTAFQIEENRISLFEWMKPKHALSFFLSLSLSGFTSTHSHVLTAFSRCYHRPPAQSTRLAPTNGQ